MRRAFRTFIGVDLGGGKGKTTAVARLRLDPYSEQPAVLVEDIGNGKPWYDARLVDYLISQHHEDTVVAMDAPLTLTACVRCTLPSCPSLSGCEVPTVRWFQARAAARHANGGGAEGKPTYTPYTQRATEVVLHEDHGIMPRETLGQGMGPLTARMAYLRHALSRHYKLNHNLLEVYPKATLSQLFPDFSSPAPEPEPPGGRLPASIRYKDSNGKAVSLNGTPRRPGVSQVAQKYKRSGHALPIRERVLTDIGLRFGPGQWREFVLRSDHQFDALICAYSAFLWARDGWEMPAEPVFAEDGWIWFPPPQRSAR